MGETKLVRGSVTGGISKCKFCVYPRARILHMTLVKQKPFYIVLFQQTSRVFVLKKKKRKEKRIHAVRK